MNKIAASVLVALIIGLAIGYSVGYLSFERLLQSPKVELQKMKVEGSVNGGAVWSMKNETAASNYMYVVYLNVYGPLMSTGYSQYPGFINVTISFNDYPVDNFTLSQEQMETASTWKIYPLNYESITVQIGNPTDRLSYFEYQLYLIP
jgi:hypothetical protein